MINPIDEFRLVFASGEKVIEAGSKLVAQWSLAKRVGITIFA